MEELFIRNNYESIKRGLSSSNEPPVNKRITVDIGSYPDMKKAYENFSKILNIPTNRFVLSNGAENAIKNTLLALKPKSIFYSEPTWGMLDVYCEALSIKKYTKSFLYKKNYIEEPFLRRRVDLYYSTNGRNNLFSYIPREPLHYKYKILDLTYFSIEYIKKEVKKSSRNTIIVGSFDKSHGAGLRLGFTIFPLELNRIFNIQREQFINPVACSFLNNFYSTSNSYKQRVKQVISKLSEHNFNIFSYCDNYITLKGNFSFKSNVKSFFIKDSKGEVVDFTRIGIPKNNSELKTLYKDLKKLRKITLYENN